MAAAAADKGLILADGTKLPDCTAGWTKYGIWLHLVNVKTARAFKLFSDPAKTAVIRFVYGKMEDRLEGYTSLAALLVDSETEIRIRMTGEDTRAQRGLDSEGF